MSLLSIKHVFGVRTNVSGSIAYLDEHCYLYPSSRHIVLYNTDYKSQRLISYGNDFDVFEALAVSANKQMLAIALSTLDKCRISIYDLSGPVTTPVRRRKFLAMPHVIRSTHVVSLIFSANSKLLIALYGSPEYMLVCWSVDRLKSIVCVSLHTLHIDLTQDPLNLQVSFNPMDSSQILLTGNHLFRRYRLFNGRLSSIGQGQTQRVESINVTCHCWLNEHDILLGLDTGIVCTVNKHGEITHRYNDRTRTDEDSHLLYRSSNAISASKSRSRSVPIRNDNDLSIKSSSRLASLLEMNRRTLSAISIGQRQRWQKKNSPAFLRQSSPTLDNQNQPISNDIICLLPFSRGVFISTAAGQVIMYERAEGSDQLTYLRKLILPSSVVTDSSLKKTQTHSNTSIELHKRRSGSHVESLRSSFSHDLLNSNGRLIDSHFEIVRSLALSPNEETLLAGTNINHLYEIAFSKVDYTKKEASIFSHALDAGHNGAVISAAVCIRKAIVVTLGTDRCLKIWNLQTNNQELNHVFVDEPFSLSLHPTGVFFGVSFVDTVQIYCYTTDGLTQMNELRIPNARCIEYSNGGHMLAVAFANNLEFHLHSNYEQVIYVKTSIKKLRLIRWTTNDAFVITVDFDDLITKWDPHTCQRISEYQIRNFVVQDLLISADNKVAYLVATDKKVKEFLLMTTLRDLVLPFDDCIPSTLGISHTARYLFVGSHKGSICCLKLTQTNAISNTNAAHESVQISAHQGALTKILVSFNNQLVISTGEDGNLIIYNLNEYQDKKEAKIVFRDELFAKEIVLKQQRVQLSALLQRESEIAHQYRSELESQEDEYVSHLRELDVRFQAEIENMQLKLNDLRQEKVKLEKNHQQQLSSMIQQEEQTLHRYVEEKSEQLQIISNHDQHLVDQMNNLGTNEYQQMALVTDGYQRRIELIQLAYQKKLEKMKDRFSRERMNVQERVADLEEMKTLYDEDAEMQITLLRQHYETQLRTIVDRTEQMENEQVVLEARLQQLEHESYRFENQMKEFEIERDRLVQNIRQVDSDIATAKQTVQEREVLIQEKLARTTEMERRRDELEKFAYVFNYKIRELTSEIGPREHEVRALIEQYNNMDAEYDALSKNNEKYTIKIADMKARLRATEKELQNETQAIRTLNQTSANMKEDFELCCKLIDQPKQLIGTIRKIYGKYVLNIDSGVVFGQMNTFDGDRQRAYFERSYQRLQRKIVTDVKNEKLEEVRRVEEQMNIMREISSYCSKVAEVERTLSDLNIAYHVAMKTGAATSDEIVRALALQQASDFVEQKQTELDSILDKQRKRIEQLRLAVLKLEQQSIDSNDQCNKGFTPSHHASSSMDQSNTITPHSLSPTIDSSSKKEF